MKIPEDKYTDLRPYKGYGIQKSEEYNEFGKKEISYDIYELDDPEWLVDSRPTLKEAKKLIDSWK